MMNNKEQEDMYFAHQMLQYSYSIPPINIAYEFCREVGIDSIERSNFKENEDHVPIQRNKDGTISHLALHAAWQHTELPQEMLKMMKNSVSSLL